MATPQEGDRLLTTWNETQADYLQDRCIHQYFGSVFAPETGFLPKFDTDWCLMETEIRFTIKF